MAACLVAAFVGLVSASTDEEIWGALRFTPTLRGARYAALGSAGIALVDDAAAVVINPARLPALLDQELLFEARTGSVDEVSHDGGLQQFNPAINPFAGSTILGGSTPEDLRAGLISWSYPIPLRLPLVIGASLDGATESIRAVSSVDTVPLSAPVTPAGGDNVLRISTGAMDRTSRNLTLAAGWGLTPDFWIGGAVVAGRLEVDAVTTGSLADPLQFTGPGMFDPRFSGTAPEPLRRTTTDDSDTSFALSAGAFFRPHPAMGLSVVWREGARYELTATTLDLVSGASTRFSSTVKLPDRAALGLAWSPFLSHPSPTLRTLKIAVDVERVSYGDLVEDLVVGQNILTSPDFVGSVSYGADDATEVHLGVEWLRIQRDWTLALRAGGYTDENASITLSGISGDMGALQGQSAALARGGFFEPTESEAHLTGGIGLGFYRLDVDMAVDYSEPQTRVVFSTRYRFR